MFWWITSLFGILCYGGSLGPSPPITIASWDLIVPWHHTVWISFSLSGSLGLIRVQAEAKGSRWQVTYARACLSETHREAASRYS